MVGITTPLNPHNFRFFIPKTYIEITSSLMQT